MKKLVGMALAGLLLTGSATVLGAVPAQAHNVPCVSKAEFRKVKQGFRMKRVHRVFDVKGKQDWFYGATPYSFAEQGRVYRACSHYWKGGPHGDVYVDFERGGKGYWRLTSKSAYW